MFERLQLCSQLLELGDGADGVLDRVDGVLTPHLSTRASNVLNRAGIETFEQLRAIKPSSLFYIPRCGLKMWREIMRLRRKLSRRLK